MSKSRRDRGFIWGQEQAVYAHLKWYVRALSSTNLRDEEYFVHSALNGPSHATNLVNEVFDERVRNNITNTVDVNSLIITSSADVSNDYLSQEGPSVRYSRVADPTTIGAGECRGDDQVRISGMLDDMFNSLESDNQKKVFAWRIALSGIESSFQSIDSFFASINPGLSELILEIVSRSISETRDIIEWVGTRYAFEVARSQMLDKLKNNYEYLLRN